MAAACQLQQQTVLWEGALELERYGEGTAEARFAQPVLVTGVRATAGSLEGGLQLPQLVKGHARDLHTPTAARFDLLFNAVAVPQHEMQEWRVDQVFPTQHVWLRGRCRSITVQLLGFALDDAPQQIKAAAEARFGPLPKASPLLLFTSAQQGSQKQAAGSPAATLSLPRPPGRQLPLGKIPPAFVLTLAPVAQYWGCWVPQLPLPPGRPKPHTADLIACQEMAEAVLAAQRGSPAVLKAKLANTKNVQRLAVDWDGIRDSVLDMATYCCSALGDNLVEPTDVALASAGVSAAIMLAACQDGAAQFLAWPSGGVGVAGAIAVRDLVSTPNQPGLWQAWSMGLLDLLLESCPAVAGPTLQGTLNPAGIPEPQPAQDAAADADAAGSAAAEPLLPQGDDGTGPADETHEDASAAAAAGVYSVTKPAGSAGGEAATEAAHGLPAAKRQRLEQHADAPATELAAADAAADAQPSAQQTPPSAEPEQEHGTDELGRKQVDDALLAGLEQDSENPTNEQTGPGAAARRKRQRRQQDADVDADGLDEVESSEQDGGSGCWGAADRVSEEPADAAGGQQQGGEGQEVALEEGDYPEADEEAIRAEAAAKAARRRVERRPPVCELAGRQLYAAILRLSMSPMCHSAAISCKSVLRRLRAYQCLDALQAGVNPVLSGKVDPLQLSTQDLCSIVNSAAAAANDLAALVLQPRPSSRSLFLYAQPEGQADSSVLLSPPPQEADFCVLQLLLSFRAMELLSAVSCCIGAHLSRLTQAHPRQQEGANQRTQQQQHDRLQPQSPSQQQPQQPPDPPDEPAAMLAAEQQSRLCLQHAQLLDSVRALTSALTASSGGWSFLTAARDGLAALAAAVCPTRQVCLDGGPFSPDTAAPYDPQHGWEAAREALTAAGAGLAGESAGALHGAGGSAYAAGDLSDSLQRLWLLVEATAALQGAGDVLSGKDKTPGAVDKLNAAMKTLFVGGFASELGQQSLVSALSACSPAVNQLGALLKHCSQVHAAAAEAEEDQAPGSQQSQDRGLNLSLGLRVVYGALYAPEVLLALVSSPHIDAIATWLPLTNVLHDAIRQQLYQHDASAAAAAAARAAFPNVLALDPAALQECGLPTAVLPGGAAAAQGSSQAVLMQLHGAVLTAHNLVQLWQGRDAWAPLGSGSAGKLLEWLHVQLPKLEAAASKTAEPSEPEGVAPKLPKTASAAYVAAQASDSNTHLDGAAAAGGAAPPAGRDVRSDAVVEFMHSAGCRSAALCSLHLLDMLLRGAPQSIRSMAQQEHRKASSGTKQTVAAFVPAWPLGLERSGSAGVAVSVDDAAVAVSVDGAAGEGDDGFSAREVVQELLDGVPVKPHAADQATVQVEVFELLERALRTATVALRASDADLWWLVKGGGQQQDILLVLQARTAAAALMRAACTTTASLLVHLSDADPQHEGHSSAIHHDGLLDSLICAHSAVVTCQEGLQACVPQPRLSPFITRATEPGLNPVQRAAADAAVGAASLRACGGRVLLLLEARQALAVCLRCWQLQGWWPDPVGALLGSFPRASTAAEGFAKEDAAEAHREGDPLAPPPPAPRQGPRQLLSSLLGLADLCPEEWPHRGASQAAARQHDAAGATAVAGSGDSTSKGPAAFERPSLILLRQSVADAIEVHWDSLERVVDFGLSCSTRVARLALVRMLARMAGLGAGLAPLLGPKVLLALCSRLYGIQQLRKGLAGRLLQIIQGPAPAAECSKQHLIDREINALHLQLRGTAQVCEVLLPLCGAPSIKSVLTEHKAAGVLGKAVFALVKPAADPAQLAADEEAAAGTGRAANGGGAAGSSAPAVGPGLARLGSEVQVLAGLLLQLVAVLMDPDISMNPWADRPRRELIDSPSISTSSITIAWVLAAAPHLSPANMAAVAQLLTGRSTAAAAEALAAAAAGESAGRPLDEAAGAVGAQQSAGAGASQPGGAPDRVQQPAGSAVGLSGSAKGRAVLLRVGRQWQLLEQSLREAHKREVLPSAAAAMPLAPPLQVSGSGMTQAELQASAEWAAAALEATQCAGGPDPSHAASCAAIAQVLRELGGSSSACTSAWQEYEAVVEAEAQQQLKPQHTWTKFIVAANSAAAAHRPGGPNQQTPATLLSSPPLLLACDAACLDFWAASAASVQHAEACPVAPAHHPHTAERPTASASSWWPQPLLVGGSNPGPRSQAVEDAMEAARQEDKKKRDRADEGGPGGGGGDDDDQGGGGGGGPEGGFVPAVYAQRGPQFLRDDKSSRKASKHVDEFQRQQCYTCGLDGHLAAACPQGGALTCFNCGQDGHLARDCPQGPIKCYKCGEEGHLARDCLVPDKCHRCGQEGHLMKDCKASAAQRGVGPPPPPPPPPPPRPREGPGPGLPPWHGRSSSVPGVPGVQGARQLVQMHQAALPQQPQVSPRDACGGGSAGAPADPRLKARRSSQQGGTSAGGSVSPLSPSGGSGSGSGLHLAPAGGSGGYGGLLLWPHSGVLPPGVRLPVHAGGGGVLTPPAAAPGAVAATPGADGVVAGEEDVDADADAALLQGLLVDDSQDAAAAAAAAAAGGTTGQEQVDGETGIGQYLDDLLGGVGHEGEDQEPDDEGGYGVTEAGGL